MTLLRLRPSAAIFAAAVTLIVSTTAWADGLVVYASGPSADDFPIGRKLADKERITLRANDRIRILNDGSTRDLRGPGSYSLDQQRGSSRTSALAVLTEQRSSRRARTGALRGGGDTQRRPNLWQIDTGRPGTVCLVSTERIGLWRRSVDGAATFTFTSTTGTSHTVTFGDGEMLAAWDTTALPISEGEVFEVAGPDGARIGELRFTIIDQVSEEPEALAEQLIAHGCLQQLDVLSSALLAGDE